MSLFKNFKQIFITLQRNISELSQPIALKLTDDRKYVHSYNAGRKMREPPPNFWGQLLFCV